MQVGLYRTRHKPLSNPIAGPVAQSVEHWTPCGGSTHRGYKSLGFEAQWALYVYGTPAAGCYRLQPVEVGEGPAVRGNVR